MRVRDFNAHDSSDSDSESDEEDAPDFTKVRRTCTVLLMPCISCPTLPAVPLALCCDLQ